MSSKRVRRTRLKKKILVGIFVTVAFLSLAFGILKPYLPLYATSIGLVPSLVGLAISMRFFGNMVARLIGGVMSDNFGEKTTACVGIIISLVGTGALIFPNLFLVACLVLGFGMGLRRPPLMVATGRVATKRLLGAVYGVFTTSLEMPGAIAPMIGAFLITYGYTPLIAMSMVLITISLFPLQALHPSKPNPPGERSFFRARVLGSKLIKLCMFSGFVGGVTVGVACSIWPLFVIKKVNADYVGVGLTYMAYSLTAIFLSPFMGSLSDRIGRKKNIVLGSMFFALSCYLFTLSKTLTQIVVLEIFSGIAGALIVPAVLALISESTDSGKRGKVMGIYSIMPVLGGIVGSSLGGIFYTYSIDYPLFFCMFMELAFGFLFLLWGVRSPRRSPPRNF